MPRLTRFMLCVWLLLLARSGIAADETKNKDAQTSTSCLECHADHGLKGEVADGKERSLFTDTDILASSAHSALECVDCHENLNGQAKPHRATAVPVDCFSCHDDTGPKHKFHARLRLAPIAEGKDTSCTECHGGHDVQPIKSRSFAMGKLGQT